MADETVGLVVSNPLRADELRWSGPAIVSRGIQNAESAWCDKFGCRPDFCIENYLRRSRNPNACFRSGNSGSATLHKATSGSRAPLPLRVFPAPDRQKQECSVPRSTVVAAPREGHDPGLR